MSSTSQLMWYNSYFHAMCIRKLGNEWQGFVTDIMHAKHGGDFIQIDPTFRGDKGCDGYVNGLMLACYGASRPTSAGVLAKMEDDLAKAKTSWGHQMVRWAFVHNNANGLPLAAAQAIIDLRNNEPTSLVIENWPPQVLWDEAVKELDDGALQILLGAPPSDRPAQMSYIADAVRHMARTRWIPVVDDVLPVPENKIEFNQFSGQTAQIIREYLTHTHLVRYYFEHGTPGEQFQVAENLRLRYDALVAAGSEPDVIFHKLCDELVEEANAGDPVEDQSQRRNAAILVVVHFFESCLIFEMPGEHDAPAE
jgi:hypothetical protein